MWLQMARDIPLKSSLSLKSFLLLGSLRFSEGELMKIIQLNIFWLLQNEAMVESPLSFEYEPTNSRASPPHAHCSLLFCMH